MLLARGRRDSIAIPVCCDALSPEMAQSEHPTVARQCPLLGVKRTSTVADLMSAFDPKRTSAAQHYRQRKTSRSLSILLTLSFRSLCPETHKRQLAHLVYGSAFSRPAQTARSKQLLQP